MDMDQSKHKKELSWAEEKLLPLVRLFCSHLWIPKESGKVKDVGHSIVMDTHEVCYKCGKEKAVHGSLKAVGLKLLMEKNESAPFGSLKTVNNESDKQDNLSPTSTTAFERFYNQ